MMKRITWMIITFGIAAILLYLSRFWTFDLWGRDGLFDVKEIRSKGGLLARWLRGTPFAPFELLIWLGGVFAVLTWLEKAYGFLGRKKQ